MCVGFASREFPSLSLLLHSLRSTPSWFVWSLECLLPPRCALVIVLLLWWSRSFTTKSIFLHFHIKFRVFACWLQKQVMCTKERGFPLIHKGKWFTIISLCWCQCFKTKVLLQSLRVEKGHLQEKRANLYGTLRWFSEILRSQTVEQEYLCTLVLSAASRSEYLDNVQR